MTFLQKLGSLIAKGLAILTGAGPLISLTLGSKAPAAAAIAETATQDLTAIGQVVVTAESILQGSGNGAQKLAASTPLVASIVKTSELVSGHDIANDTLFTQGCTKITSGVADVLNSLSDKGVSASASAPVVVTPSAISAATSVAAPVAAPVSAAPVNATPAPSSTVTDGSDAKPVPAID